MRFAVAALACAINAFATPACGFIVPLAGPQQRRDAVATPRSHHAAGQAATFSFSCGACAVVTMLAGAGMLAQRGRTSGSKSSQVAAPMVVMAAFDPTQELGITAPLEFWDPANLMKDGTGAWKDEKTFRQYREAEIKHGRLAMTAALGLAMGTFFRFPTFEKVPSGWAALSDKGGGGFGIIVLVAAFFEVIFWKQDPSKAPGDFGDPLGVGSYENYGYTDEMRNKEINHGRLAMSAVATEFLVEYGTKMTPAQQFSTVTADRLIIAFFGLVLVWAGYVKDPAESPAPTKVLEAGDKKEALLQG